MPGHHALAFKGTARNVGSSASRRPSRRARVQVLASQKPEVRVVHITRSSALPGCHGLDEWCQCVQTPLHKRVVPSMLAAAVVLSSGISMHDLARPAPAFSEEEVRMSFGWYTHLVLPCQPGLPCSREYNGACARHVLPHASRSAALVCLHLLNALPGHAGGCGQGDDSCGEAPCTAARSVSRIPSLMRA